MSDNTNKGELFMKIDALKGERDALAAKVALLVSLIKEAAEADESKDFLGHVWHDKYYDEYASVQCLAEIKAETGRAGFIAGRSRGIEYFKLTEAQAADEYAAKIRNTAIATGIIAGCSSADNEVTFLVQALKDVANPLERFNRLASLSDGKINGMVVANLLKDPETYRDIAEEALKQHAEKIRNAGTWLRDENVNGGKRQGGE